MDVALSCPSEAASVRACKQERAGCRRAEYTRKERVVANVPHVERHRTQVESIL